MEIFGLLNLEISKIFSFKALRNRSTCTCRIFSKLFSSNETGLYSAMVKFLVQIFLIKEPNIERNENLFFLQ